MDPIITTKRLFLREFKMEDAEVLFDLNADSEVLKYTGDVPFISVDQARSFVEDYKDYALNGYGRWGVIEQDSQSFLGWCGLKKHTSGFTDIGFRFFKKVWGKGYATESAKATLEYGFKNLGLSEIIGRAAGENKVSIRVLQKIGMTFWKKEACHGIEDAFYFRIFKK